MFIPTKHENLNKSTIVLGADIIRLLKKKTYTVEGLFQDIKQILQKEVSLNHYYNVLTFLWLVEVIELQDSFIILKK